MFWTANAAQAAGRRDSELLREARRDMWLFQKEQQEFLARQKKLLKGQQKQEEQEEQKP